MNPPPAVLAARRRIADVLQVTPLVPAPALSAELGAEVRIKCESLQRTGSFKPRGALNKMLQLSADERRRGVVCASAGNHAQGVAFAASRVDAPALVVMPENAPLVKVTATAAWGAEVVLHGHGFDDAVDHARRLQAERGLTFVHAFDDEQIVAGQATIALELLEQFPELDTVVVPIGGGGLIGGVAETLKTLRPEVRVYGVQTEAAPAVARAFRADDATVGEHAVSSSLADGIAVKRPAALTLDLTRRFVDDVVLVPERAIEDAIFRLLDSQKLLAEGAGAAAFAALVERLVPVAGRRVAVMLSGGNIDLNLLSRIVERSLVRRHRLARLRLTIPDRPGALAGALATVARCGANVLDIEHERFFTEAAAWETEVVVTLETRDAHQVAQLVAALREAGYGRLERLDASVDPPTG
jgi:threonine dehydratase